MPCRSSAARGPMPESIRSCGVLNAPPHRITSRAANARRTVPGPALPARGSAPYSRSPLRYSTPIARFASSNSTRVASACSSTLRRSGTRRLTSSTRSRAPTRRCSFVVSGVYRSPIASSETTRQSFGSSLLSRRARRSASVTATSGSRSAARADSRIAVRRSSSRNAASLTAISVCSHPDQPWRLGLWPTRLAARSTSRCSQRSMRSK